MVHTDRSRQIYAELRDEVEVMGSTPCEDWPDGFFIDELDPLQTEKIRSARILCGDCPIKMKCLEYALEAHEVHGIWGGLTYNERKRLISGRRVVNARVY